MLLLFLDSDLDFEFLIIQEEHAKRNVKKRKQVKMFETGELLKCKIWVNDSSYFSVAPFATKLLKSLERTEQKMEN